MANEFDKIFSDAEPSENTETLDGADEVTEESSVPSSEPKVSARESYMQSIFGDDIEESSEFEEDFDENAVYVRDKDGHFVKKDDEEENLEETEDQEDLLDEADMLEEDVENPRKKKPKKLVKKPEHKAEAVNAAIKRDIFETEAEEEIISPSVSGVSENETDANNASVSPQIDDLDKGDVFVEEPKKEAKKAHSDDTTKDYEQKNSVDNEFPSVERSRFEENTPVSPSEVKSEPEPQYIDASVEDAADEITRTSSRGKKSVSEMSSEEIARMSPEEISQLSASEKRELLERMDDSRELERQEYISGVKNADELRDNNVIETDDTPVSPIIDRNADSSAYTHASDVGSHRAESDNMPISTSSNEDIDDSAYVYTPDKEAHSTKTDDTPIPTAINESADNSVQMHPLSAEYRGSETGDAVVPTVVNETVENPAYAYTPSVENGTYSEKPVERTDEPYAPNSVSEEAEAVYVPNSVNEKNENAYTPSSVDNIVHGATDASSKEPSAESTPSPAVVYYGNRTDVDKPRQEFNAESFHQDLQSYTGYDINVVDKGDSFEVYTPKQTFTLNKASGDVVGEAGALSSIIGKTYEQYSPAPITSPQSSVIEDVPPIKPPVRVDTWSPEKVISGFDGKYGEVTVSTNENGHTVLSFPEQRGASSFSVELNNTHQPVSINNPPPFVKDVVDNIYRQNQNIAATDNAEYIRQKTIYHDAVKAQDNGVHRSSPVPIYASMGFNPNGTSTKIGDGYNLANNSQTTSARVFTNPYLNSKMHPSVIAGYRSAFVNLDKSTFVGYGPANSYVQNVYQDFVNFREQLNNNENYVNTAYSDAKTAIYNEENSKFAPFSFSDFSGSSEKTEFSSAPFVYNNTGKNSSDSRVENIQAYGSAINPVYNINGFSQYRFLQDSKQFVGRATQAVGRPLLNTFKSTASSTEVGQGARQITGYLGAPFLIGACAAYKNIWQRTNSQEMLKRTSEKARYAITNRLNNAGVFFKCSHSLDSLKGIRKIQSGIAGRGKIVGLADIGSMKYADLQTLKTALRKKTVMYQGKRIDFASAKSIVRHLGNKAPQDIKGWIEQYRLVDSAIAFQAYLEASFEHFINELKGLGIIKPNETFDLTDFRDIQILQRRLSKFAQSKGYNDLPSMSTKRLLEWIQKHQGEESAVIAEKFILLKRYQKKAKRMGNMKFARLFAIMQLIQTVMKNNDIVSGGFMMYRTIHSAIMATKATIRLIKTSARFLGFVGKKLGRFAVRTHLDVPAKAVGKVLRGTGRAVGRAVGHTRTGARVASTVKSVKSSTLAQRAVSTRKKLKAGSSLRKTKLKKFITGKPKIITKITSKITNSAAWKALSGAFAKVSAAIGDIFLGAAIGVAILFGVTAVISLVGQVTLLLYDKVTAFTEDFKETFNIETDLQKLYNDLEAQDAVFMDDMIKAGEKSYKNEVSGYYDLSKFKNGSFPIHTIGGPGDENAPEGSLNKIGYEYHLYDRMIPTDKSPSDVNAKEIPFESNAKEIISCGNIIFFSDFPDKSIVFSDGSAMSYKEALKDYALKGSKFEDKNLWTATHSFFTLPSDKYSCASGCDTFKYNCGQYDAKTGSSDNNYAVTAKANNESNVFYSLWKGNSPNLKLYGAPAPQQKYGCKKHDKNNLSNWDPIDYKYYCGLSHLSTDGNCYKCEVKNSSRKNIGHIQTVKRIKSCNEQQFVYTKQSLTFLNQTKDNKIASFCNFTSAYNKIKKNMPNSLKNNGILADNIYPFSTQITSGGKAIQGLTLNGWIYVTGEKDGNDVKAIKSYIANNVCKNCQSSYQIEKVWLGALNYIDIYCYIFYCGGETNCSHSASLYEPKIFNYTYTITGSDNTKYKIKYNNIKLSYQCNQVTTENKKVNIALPHFECVGYCDGDHTINFCKGHYNNVVTGYIIKSMDNTFDITCKNPECSLYNKPQIGVNDNICTGFLKGKHDTCKQNCLITNMNQNSIFYADSVYGPTSVGNIPHWGKFWNANDHFDFSMLGWYDKFKGPYRMSSAKIKINGDWNNLYGVSSISEINSTKIDASEADKLLELGQYGSISNGKERRAFVSLALRSSGQIPYYEGRSALYLGYDRNNFGGTATKGDIRGRTLIGLDNKSWIVWAYASSKGDMTYLTRSVNAGGYAEFDKKYEKAKAGDIIVFDDGTYGVFVGMSDKKLCVVQEVGEPQNNVTVKYYSSAKGYIPYETALK